MFASSFDSVSSEANGNTCAQTDPHSHSRRQSGGSDTLGYTISGTPLACASKQNGVHGVIACWRAQVRCPDIQPAAVQWCSAGHAHQEWPMASRPSWAELICLRSAVCLVRLLNSEPCLGFRPGTRSAARTRGRAQVTASLRRPGPRGFGCGAVAQHESGAQVCNSQACVDAAHSGSTTAGGASPAAGGHSPQTRNAAAPGRHKQSHHACSSQRPQAWRTPAGTASNSSTSRMRWLRKPMANAGIATEA